MNSRITLALVTFISLTHNTYGAASSRRKQEKAPAPVLQTFTKNTEIYTQGKIHAMRSSAGTYNARTFRKRSLVTIHGADAMKLFNALKDLFDEQPKSSQKEISLAKKTTYAPSKKSTPRSRRKQKSMTPSEESQDFTEPEVIFPPFFFPAGSFRILAAGHEPPQLDGADHGKHQWMFTTTYVKNIYLCLECGLRLESAVHVPELLGF